LTAGIYHSGLFVLSLLLLKWTQIELLKYIKYFPISMLKINIPKFMFNIIFLVKWEVYFLFFNNYKHQLHYHDGDHLREWWIWKSISCSWLHSTSDFNFELLTQFHNANHQTEYMHFLLLLFCSSARVSISFTISIFFLFPIFHFNF